MDIKLTKEKSQKKKAFWRIVSVCMMGCLLFGVLALTLSMIMPMAILFACMFFSFFAALGIAGGIHAHNTKEE